MKCSTRPLSAMVLRDHSDTGWRWPMSFMAEIATRRAVETTRRADIQMRVERMAVVVECSAERRLLACSKVVLRARRQSSMAERMNSIVMR